MKASHIAVSSRVRLARNLRDMPFPLRMTEKQIADLTERVWQVFASIPEFRRVNLDTRLDAQALVERHLISPEFTRTVILSKHDDVSVMVVEEDHLRIQALGTGLCLDECFQTARRVDTLLDSALPYAFSETYGFLTACPTNLGTALRASVMLHLPGLSGVGALRGLVHAAQQMGLAVRGFYGEGSSALGMFYQISNQVTLGVSEEELVTRLREAVESMIEKEQAARQALLTTDRVALEDRCWRALGVLSHARLLTSEDALNLLSDLRLGVSLGFMDGASIQEIDTLIHEIGPAHLTLAANRELSARERDEARAALIRKKMND